MFDAANRRWDAGKTVTTANSRRVTPISPKNRGAIQFNGGKIQIREGSRWIDLGPIGENIDSLAIDLGLPTSFQRGNYASDHFDYDAYDALLKDAAKTLNPLIAERVRTNDESMADIGSHEKDRAAKVAYDAMNREARRLGVKPADLQDMVDAQVDASRVDQEQVPTNTGKKSLFADLALHTQDAGDLNDAPVPTGSLESDSPNAAVGPVLAQGYGDATGSGGRGIPDGGRAGGEGDERPDGSSGAPSGSPTLDGERSDIFVHSGDASGIIESIAPGSDFDGGSGVFGDGGISADQSAAIASPASPSVDATSHDTRAAQAAAEGIKSTPGIDNIRATLPALLPGQQDDVFKTETRFDKPDGYGMLLTNGTGIARCRRDTSAANSPSPHHVGDFVFVDIPDHTDQPSMNVPAHPFGSRAIGHVQHVVVLHPKLLPGFQRSLAIAVICRAPLGLVGEPQGLPVGEYRTPAWRQIQHPVLSGRRLGRRTTTAPR